MFLKKDMDVWHCFKSAKVWTTLGKGGQFDRGCCFGGMVQKAPSLIKTMEIARLTDFPLEAF
jgi:hypothetical protein